MPHEALHPSEQMEKQFLKITAKTSNPVISKIQRSVWVKGFGGLPSENSKIKLSIFKMRNLPQTSLIKRSKKEKEKKRSSY